MKSPVVLILVSLSFVCCNAESGFLTFYGASAGQSGACGYGMLDNSSWPYGSFVSIGSNNSLVQGFGSNLGACGQCIQAQCVGDGCIDNAAPVQLFITDSCGCLPNQLNVPRTVFLQSFGQSAALGQVNITFQQTNCQPPGNISVKVLNSRADGGSYIAFVLLNVAGNAGILGVDLQATNGSWRPLVNTYGSVWEGSSLGEAPYSLRLTPYSMAPIVLPNAIPSLRNQTFDTGLQLTNTTASAPERAPAGSPPVQAPRRANPPRTFSPPGQVSIGAPSPGQASIIYSNIDQQISLSGVRINVPLYYAPLDSSLLGGYPGLTFNFPDCAPSNAVLNLTIDRLQVPSQQGSPTVAWSIHAVSYRPVAQVGATQIYVLEDFSFMNLETGSFAQLAQPIYVTFSNSTFDGSTIPVVDPTTRQTVYPVYLNASAINTPGSLLYNLLLPPGPNEAATAVYLTALKSFFYYLTTLTLGNDGSTTTSPICGPGFPALGPWADYLRTVLADVAPADGFIGSLYNNVPIGPLYSFEQRSFVINNAVIVGQPINTTSQLSASDCGTQCRNFAVANTGNSSALCSAWSWCGSITGCDSLAYQVCQLKASTLMQNITAASGFLSLTQNSSTRATSGSLVLPPPTGITPLFVNATVPSTGPASAGRRRV